MVEDTLKETKKLVWPEIKRYLKDPPYPKQFQISKKFKEPVDLYWKINNTYPERKGKYLRPTFLRLIAESLEAPTNETIKVAAAMQISEEWILIHDDVEDKSESRRGSPTLHKMYGNELAINAGDALNTIMWRLISGFDSEKLKDEFYSILMRTVLGQGVEQIWTNKRKNLTENEYFFIADSKSAYYSIAGPMRLGAIIAGASPSQIDKITKFGQHLGRCFQLVDDLIDADQDKVEGKITLVATRGVEFTKKLAEKEKNIARMIFDKDLIFLSGEPARTELKELIDFILERKY